MRREYETHNESETKALAADIAAGLQSGDVLAFKGGLGAGKTAFVGGLASGLGAGDVVSSPTFALVHEYTGGKIPLYHFDMYRVGGWDDLYSTGFFDYLEMGGILAVEWSENIEAALPGNCIHITIETLSEHSRRITIDGGDRF